MILTASYTDIGGRPRNEDAVRIKVMGGERACVVLADGLGGHGGGEIASQTAAEMVCGGWNGMATPGFLSELIQGAHRKIRSLQTPACRMKSTIVALSLTPGQADWAYAGDSRLYYFMDGTLVHQTRDHSASQIAVLLGEIKPEEIRFHEDRSHIFRALGQDGGLNVDAGSQSLCRGRHAFLLCSDGFWEYVYEREMERELAASATPQEWLDRMRRLLGNRTPKDNDNNTAAAVWLTV